MDGLLFSVGFVVGWLCAVLVEMRVVRRMVAAGTKAAQLVARLRPAVLEYAEPDNPEGEDELTRQRREAERGFWA